jgi:ribosomal protein S18 acetylase RimI-like enzyme
VTIERLGAIDPAAVDATAAAIVTVLLDAFDVGADRRTAIERETSTSLRHPWFTHYLVRVDGVPASVARRATFDDASYLSSIGTAGWARGRGLGGLVTRSAVADAIRAGSRWTYLGVFADNPTAIGIYERAGLRQLGRAAPDLLLVG